MKVLAKIGLIAAAAATILFIFLYESDDSWSDERSMASAPLESASVEKTPKSADMVDAEELTVEEDEAVPSEPASEAEPILDEPVEKEDSEPDTPEEVEEQTPAENVNMRRIYGKITLSTTGENLAGVNIMVPGSNVAKVSNNIGGYTIQVPRGTRELVFIYRGKRLVQPLSSADNLLNVRLNWETMQYD